MDIYKLIHNQYYNLHIYIFKQHQKIKHIIKKYIVKLLIIMIIIYIQMENNNKLLLMFYIKLIKHKILYNL